MKWNWGTKIGLVFAAFCALMIFMVIKSFQTEFHLVTENYYEEELKYQDRIDQNNNTNALELKPIVTIDEQTVKIKFVKPIIKGSIHFYRPDNANFDKVYEVTEQEFSIQKSELVEGRYTIKMSWDEGIKSYFLEQEAFITK